MIYIRTDANEKIATGHMMRCITIATEVKKMDCELMFIVSDLPSVKMLEGVFLYYKLQTPTEENVYAEIEEIKKIISTDANPVILLDLYKFDARYMEEMKKIAKIATFDDMFEEKYPADIIINYNMYYRIFDYKKRYKNEKVKLLLGGSFIPLRAEFKIAYADQKESVEDVMVICGGGDKYHILYPLTKKICSERLNESIRFHIVVGRLNPDKEKFKEICGEENIYIYENVENMPFFMEKMDVAVSAASTVLYECCKMTIPTVFFCMEENQKYDKQCFAEDNVMLYAGDIRCSREAVLDEIVRDIRFLSCNKDIREQMKRKMEKMVDGYGAERIANEIIGLEREKNE